MRRAEAAAAPALALTLALAVSACASSGAGPSQTQTQKLAADCQARGGILTASGLNTGRPEVDNVCTIRGGSPRR